MTDEGGVLGNLPNSRPGKRSAKRDRPAKAAEKAAVKAEASGTAAAKPARGTKAKRGGPPRRTTAVKGGGSGDGVRVDRDMHGQRGQGSSDTSGDPLSAAVRTAAGLAVTGVKVGGAVTKELLRRLPRP
jgi:hypothetical protein